MESPTSQRALSTHQNSTVVKPRQQRTQRHLDARGSAAHTAIRGQVGYSQRR